MGDELGPSDSRWWVELLFGGAFESVEAILAVFGALTVIFTVALWIITSTCMTRIAIRAGLARPVVHAWTPGLNFVLPFRLAGFVGPWKWVGVIALAVLASILISFIPVPGIAFVLPVAIWLFVFVGGFYMALGVQAGLGLRSSRGGFIPGALVYVFLPLVWLIWMSVRAGKVDEYDWVGAYTYGGRSFPLQPGFARAGDPWSGSLLHAEAAGAAAAQLNAAPLNRMGSGSPRPASDTRLSQAAETPPEEPDVEAGSSLHTYGESAPRRDVANRQEYSRPDQSVSVVGASSLEDDDWS